MKPNHIVTVDDYLNSSKWQKKADRPGAAALIYRGQSFGVLSTRESLAKAIKTRLLTTPKNCMTEDFGIEPYLEAIRKQEKHRSAAEIHLYFPHKEGPTLLEVRRHVFASFPSVLKAGPNYTKATEELLQANFPTVWKDLQGYTLKIWSHQWQKKYGV